MFGRRSFFVLLLLALSVTAAAVAASSFGSTGTGAIVNFTPGTLKIKHTGGTSPSSSYSDLGRVQLPVGSWVLTAHLDVFSKASSATAVECFLTVPGAPSGHDVVEIGAGKGINRLGMSLLAATTTPNGGNADLLCRVTDSSADRKVFAQVVGIAATSVNGAAITYNPAPSSF